MFLVSALITIAILALVHKRGKEDKVEDSYNYGRHSRNQSGGGGMMDSFSTSM